MSTPHELVLRESDTGTLRIARHGSSWSAERREGDRITAALHGTSIGVEPRETGCELWIGSACLDTFADAYDAIRGFIDAQQVAA